ncbi:hypothetical protein B0H13DRAFT_1927092 [Mycena leptocephala]|nr:hypothetical protein B0H13DRAFT_1927092 [Mycena leptocephala]
MRWSESCNPGGLHSYERLRTIFTSVLLGDVDGAHPGPHPRGQELYTVDTNQFRVRVSARMDDIGVLVCVRILELIPAFPEDYESSSAIEPSTLPNLCRLFKGQFPGVKFMSHEDGLYMIGERGQARTTEQGQKRNEKKKAAGSLQYVAEGIWTRSHPHPECS